MIGHRAKGQGPRGWRRYLFYRTECIKTTWTFRGACLAGVLLVLLVTRGWWIAQIGGGLICEEALRPAEAILVDNLDTSYVLFERAAALHRGGMGGRVFVTVPAVPESDTPNLVSAEIAKVMARVARLPHMEMIPVHGIEPISLHAAYQVREVLERERIGSVLLLAPLFRSRRSALVHEAALAGAGIAVYCVPVATSRKTRVAWAETWHGIQEVAEQFLKLQFYRFYVLPFQG